MKQKILKSYVVTFLMSFALILVLEIITHASGGYFLSSGMTFEGKFAQTFNHFIFKSKEFVLGNYVVDLICLIAIPIVFTLLFFLIDVLTKVLKGKKKREAELEEMRYNDFADSIGKELNRLDTFSIEDFRHFRGNEKFQECLKKLYKIYKDGEDENNSYFLVLRKFEKRTKEREAIEYLITFTENKRKEKAGKEELNDQL